MPLTAEEKSRVRAWEAVLREAASLIEPETVITMRYMFGGAGFYAAEPLGVNLMFAGWFGGETFALKAAPETRDALFAHGGKPITTPDIWIPLYAEVPPDMAEDPAALAPFVAESLAFARRVYKPAVRRTRRKRP
jgi:TfoX/Sxy family transcriptional regulator of competence genes